MWSTKRSELLIKLSYTDISEGIIFLCEKARSYLILIFKCKAY